ncbi:hypothetical protein GCM10010121_068690 [Streptomyces brasiliensis]|uniref:Uncharacterized protein n=1 Tax=Streptomyces brasiliensis TaxID=1954 RepID=A0A917L9C9_9ACTN|nr:hypothetical protein GCM10010121_068690 [Streptomyces brasiliensis]
MAGAPPLVRMVDATIGEALAGVSAGVVADVVVFTTVDDLRLSGTAGWIQLGLTGGLVVVGRSASCCTGRACGGSSRTRWHRRRCRTWSRRPAGCGRAAVERRSSPLP